MSRFIPKLTTMTTTVFTTKILRPNIDNIGAIKHMSALHRGVKRNPNFIKATSYWNGDYTKIHTISHWKDSKGWEGWLSGKERYSTYGKREKEIYESESHEYLSEIVRTNNIFLL